MPATQFICPDGAKRNIKACLSHQGCRMSQRCATLPYLRHISNQRPFTRVSPSSAGNGPRYIYLKAIYEYAIDPLQMTWAVIGTAAHQLLAQHAIVENVLQEQRITHDDIEGIPDILEQDEFKPGSYLLTDYKTFGSYKVAKCLGIEATDEPVLDAHGKPIFLISGKNKGKPKTRKIFTKTAKPDLQNESLQLNQYRIMFEAAGFPVSRMQLQVIVRDGATYIAKSRGIDSNMYIIDIPRLSDASVYDFYRYLQFEVDEAFLNGWTRRCDCHESWQGRRCGGYCEVVEQCKQMDKMAIIQHKAKRRK